jgi:hypothetical protein
MPTSIDRQPGENETECAHCGAIIYDQLTRCPNCGINLYEPEDDEVFRGTISPRRKRSFRQWVESLFNISTPADELFGASLLQAQRYNDLLVLAGRDRNLVEQWIAAEQRRSPRGNRGSWLQSALERQQSKSHQP